MSQPVSDVEDECEVTSVAVPPPLPPSPEEEEKAAKREKYLAQQVEKFAVLTNPVQRFALYLKTQGIDVRKQVKPFLQELTNQVEMAGLGQELSFGKYAGTTYNDMWKDPKKRQYLRWIIAQEWCYEDVKRSVAACEKFYRVSKVSASAWKGGATGPPATPKTTKTKGKSRAKANKKRKVHPDAESPVKEEPPTSESS